MQDYRNIKGFSSHILNISETLNYALSFNYENFLKFLSLTGGVSYSSSKQNTMSGQRFEGDRIIAGALNKDMRYNTLTYRINGRKYVPGIQSTFSVSANYSLSETERMQQDLFLPFTTAVLSLNPGIDLKINKNATLAYQAHYTNTNRKISRGTIDSHLSLNQLSGNLTGIYLIRNFSIKAQAEHLRNDITPDTSTGLFFADLETGCKIGSTEFSLSWNNIFNRKEYAYMVTNLLNVYSYRYSLRPANVLARVIFKY
jgi:hypothetical protein